MMNCGGHKYYNKLRSLQMAGFVGLIVWSQVAARALGGEVLPADTSAFLQHKVKVGSAGLLAVERHRSDAAMRTGRLLASVVLRPQPPSGTVESTCTHVAVVCEWRGVRVVPLRA